MTYSQLIQATKNGGVMMTFTPNRTINAVLDSGRR
jgi:hypothetical protein